MLGVEGTGWDIGQAVRFLVSAQARFVTGQVLVVDGGATAGALNTAPKRGQAAPPRGMATRSLTSGGDAKNAAVNAYTHSTLALYHDTGGAAPAGDAARRIFEAGISDADFATTNFGFRYNDFQVGTLVKPVDSGVHLFVVKFELSAADGEDSVTVWIDPALGTGDPTGGVTISGLDLLFESIAFSDYASNSGAFQLLG